MKYMNMQYKNSYFAAAAAGFLLLLFSVVYIVFGGQGDVSAFRKESRCVFGVTYMTMNNPYYKVIDENLRSLIEGNGDVLLKRDAALNQDRQNEEIRELISAGAELIFVVPVQWTGVEEGLRIAAAAGVPVIILDAPAENDELASCSIISDNYEAGVLCAKHLMENRDSAEILLLEHISASSGRERIQGFLDTIEGHDSYRVVGSGESDGQIENAMPVMERLLRQHPQADTVMALNDPSAFGAMAAIEAAGLLDRFYVYGVDGSPEAKTLIKDGMMVATCAQFPSKVASSAVRTAYAVLGGRPVADKITVEVELITKDNVSEFDTEGWQ